MTAPARAVFLSYASQDADAAQRICEALRAAGIEVWFDQSELRGGDAWDHQIRQRIHDCALFVPVISANTDARSEGYFRLEWKLAVDRSHLMADDAAFLFPVVIDDTPDQAARVPDKFRAVQWTRLPGGAASPAFCQRITALLAGSEKPARATTSAPQRLPYHTRRPAVLMTLAILLAGAATFLGWWVLHRAQGTATDGQKATAAAANTAPAHSIAVLPFADLSAAGDQQYFSDGLAEELLSLLSKVPGLQVAARTSAFSFKGKAIDIPTIGRQLMVANVLEGSVRKVGNHLRVSAQLVRADNGYEVWSGMYDREMGDVFRLQDEISAAVVKALKVTLLEGNAPRSASTQNTDAYLLFLKARAKMANQRIPDIKSAAADFTRVIQLDPNYGPAYVELASAKVQLAEFEITDQRPREFTAATGEAKLLLERALALDPSNAQAYVQRGYLRAFGDFAGAERDYRRAIELDPNSARAYEALATHVYGDPRRRDEALTLLDQARRLDPLEQKYDVLKAVLLFYTGRDLAGADALLTGVVARHSDYLPALQRLAEVKRAEGRFAESAMYAEQALKLDPLSPMTRLMLIYGYIESGDLHAARQVADEDPHQLGIDRIRLLIHDGDWHQAAELTYAAVSDGTMVPLMESWAILAIRMDARATRAYGRARAVLERRCGVRWNAQGVPSLTALDNSGASACIALGDVLLASGERERGDRLLRATLAGIDHAVHDLKQGELWFRVQRAVANALLGDRKAAIAALDRAVGNADTPMLWAHGMDAAFSFVSDDPEVQALDRQAALLVAQQRRELDRLRAEGRIPDRGSKK